MILYLKQDLTKIIQILTDKQYMVFSLIINFEVFNELTHNSTIL
jgi:hypothetical protein